MRCQDLHVIAQRQYLSRRDKEMGADYVFFPSDERLSQNQDFFSLRIQGSSLVRLIMKVCFRSNRGRVIKASLGSILIEASAPSTSK